MNRILSARRPDATDGDADCVEQTRSARVTSVSVSLSAEAERGAAQAELADSTSKLDGLRQQMQKQEEEFRMREAKMLGSGVEDINKLRGELEAAKAHIINVQQVSHTLMMMNP